MDFDDFMKYILFVGAILIVILLITLTAWILICGYLEVQLAIVKLNHLKLHGVDISISNI